MSERPPGNLARARRLVHDLRTLAAVAPPPGLDDRVLTAVGLRDGYTSLPTPLGPAWVAFSTVGLTTLDLTMAAPDFERAYHRRTGRRLARLEVVPLVLERVLARWARGEAADLPIDLRGLSVFEQAVLRKALEIPRGEVRPYGWIAHEIGRPGAARAVGSALGRNPLPLLIPCHRVVRGDGRLGQYALGDAAKRRLLEAERIDVAALDALARAGTRFVGSDTTGIFCFPTCRHARRITPPHRVAFASGQRAMAAGYRPCRHCRPAITS